MIDERISLYLRDPDGVLIEITSPNNNGVSPDYVSELFRELPVIEEIGREMRLEKFDHASPITSDPELTVRFFDKFVGLRNSFTRPNPDEVKTSIVAVGNRERPDFLRYLATSNARDGYVGTGSIHHIAMAVEDDRDQRKIMDRLNAVGFQNSGVIDRFWFKSLYFRDPDGNLLEIATKGPGYGADEPLEKLGTRLVLPPWLEPRRTDIETHLEETDRANSGRWPPSYPIITSSPESLTQEENQA
jgi:glyoxalase family protein